MTNRNDDALSEDHLWGKNSRKWFYIFPPFKKRCKKPKKSQRNNTVEDNSSNILSSKIIYAIFIIRQLIQKATFLCIVDVKQEFDQARLFHIATILHQYGIINKYFRIIIELNKNSKTYIKVQQSLTKEINISRRVDAGYSMSDKFLKILYYAAWIENENNLHFLFRFKRAAENMT